jgi:predicted nucleic acid-binding protein
MGRRPRKDAGQPDNVILIDTSAWVEFLRDTGSLVCDRVDALLDDEVATCHPVRMEVLAGARDEQHLSDLRGLLARASLIPTEPSDYEEAAALYRTCRRRGETVRRLIDCLIGATAIRASVSVLHSDTDFDVLARHTALAVDGEGAGN